MAAERPAKRYRRTIGEEVQPLTAGEGGFFVLKYFQEATTDEM